jgi:sporulation protein YlmC with PRC-barrel domain
MSGFSDRIGSVAPTANRLNETYHAPRETPDMMVHAINQTRSTSSSSWVYWALPFLALAGLAWYLLSGDGSSGPVAVAPQGTLSPVQASVADLERQTITAIDSFGTSLQSVRDRASATQVLPELQQAASELDRLSGLAGRLPMETRDQLAERIKTAAGRLKTALDDVTAMPGLAPDVKPAIAALQTKLDSLVMTPGSVAQQRIGAMADRVGYLARSASAATSVSTFFDRRVYNGAGEEIGTVHDLAMSTDGKIVTAVIGVGGFLGIGEKEVAVPFSSMRVERRDGDWRLVMSATKEELKAAPTYEDTGQRIRLTPVPAPTGK